MKIKEFKLNLDLSNHFILESKEEKELLEARLYKEIQKYFNSFNALPYPGHTIYFDECKYSFILGSYTTYNDNDIIFIDVLNGYDI